MKKWQCIKNCGACCNLEPNDRPDLEDYLTPELLELYLSMVGENGWCINYNHDTRECNIYGDRPIFCRVTPETFSQMYQINSSEFNDFAIDCCHQQIESIYGDESQEIHNYKEQVR